jgi:hypothetical protein
MTDTHKQEHRALRPQCDLHGTHHVRMLPRSAEAGQ